VTSNIHMLADTFGRPLRFRITPGQASHITAAPDLLEGQQADAVLADKAYDSNDLREQIKAMGAEAVTPSKRNRKLFILHDVEAYKHRNRIERRFNRLNISAASPHATTDVPSTSKASSTSPPP
jgi:putative transposase